MFCYCALAWYYAMSVKLLLVSKYLLGIFFTKDSGMTNSVDPDQTAPEGASLSGSALFAYGIC